MKARTVLSIAVLLLGIAIPLVQSGCAEPEPETKQPATRSSTDPKEAGPIELVNPDGDEPKVSDFMRRKLAASGEVLEGLVTEDFEMIAKGAKTMSRMSRASDWQMHEGPLYVQFSNEFRKICDDLVEAADQENVDGAGLAYMRLTMGCITCHNYVRKQTMADLKPNTTPTSTRVDGR